MRTQVVAVVGSGESTPSFTISPESFSADMVHCHDSERTDWVNIAPSALRTNTSVIRFFTLTFLSLVFIVFLVLICSLGEPSVSSKRIATELLRASLEA